MHEATSREILREIARSRGDTQPVFDAITRLALKLCNGSAAGVFTYDGTLVHIGATAFTDPMAIAELRPLYPRAPSRDTAVARAVLRPYPSDEMLAWPVARTVNSPRNNGPELIERWEAPASDSGT